MDNLDRMYRHLVRTIRSRFPKYLTEPFDVGELYQTILPYRHYRRELGLETNDDYEITLTELLTGARDYLIVDDHMRDVLKAELAATNPDPSSFKQFATVRVALSPGALRTLDAGPAVDPGTPDIALPFLLSTAEQPARESMPASRPAATSATAAAASAPPSSKAPPAPRPSAPVVPPPTATAPPPQPRASLRETAPAVIATPNTPPAVASIGRLSGGISQPGTGSIIPNAGERCRSCDGALPEGRAITFCPHCGQNLTTMNCPACGSELELGWNFCPTCGRPATTER
jgi:Double zinc ribbon